MSELTNLNGYSFKLIGDPHIGRIFKTGVPLARLGERETLVENDLASQLLTLDNIPTIIMGDLFDKYHIPDNLTLWLSDVLNESSKYKKVYILRGNHCVSKDVDLRGSFDVLERLCPDVVFVNTTYLITLPKHQGTLVLFGYDAFKSAKELAESIPDGLNYLAAYGHWDITAHGEDTHNLIPIETLKEKGITAVYTGHIHKHQKLQMSGINVTVVGSMQPYAHGEEAADDPLYQTFYADEAKGMLEENPSVFHMTNLRVLLQADDVWGVDHVDCLSLVFKRIEGDRAVEDITVGYDDFSSEAIFNKNLTEVSEGLRQHITARIEHYRNLEN